MDLRCQDLKIRCAGAARNSSFIDKFCFNTKSTCSHTSHVLYVAALVVSRRFMPQIQLCIGITCAAPVGTAVLANGWQHSDLVRTRRHHAAEPSVAVANVVLARCMAWQSTGALMGA